MYTTALALNANPKQCFEEANKQAFNTCFELLENRNMSASV